MIKKSTSNRWLKLLVVIVLILGVFFRFFNIQHKVYWFDETFTSLRVSGYTESEVVPKVCNGQVLSVQDLQKYQKLGNGKTLRDTIRSLALEDPQHPPLYFSIAHLWTYWFGNSIGTIRTLSAVISLMVFPSLYWLCLELFDSPVVGLVAIALIAVSPIHVLFAQEAREYSLWTLTTLLSSVSLLRAIRLNTKPSWIVYAITLAFSFYTFIFSCLVSIGHFIYIAVTEKWRMSKCFINYIIASLSGILIFVPWIVVLISNRSRLEETTEWIATMNSTLPFLFERWLLNYSRIFVDTGSNHANPFIYLLTLIIIAYSIYFLFQKTTQRISLFVIILTGVLALTLMSLDIIKGGVRSVVPRYLFPSYLGVILAVAYLISVKINATFLKNKILGKTLLLVLMCGGIISCTIISQADTWWLKGGSFKEPVMPQIARIINQSANPFVISSCEGVWRVNDKLSLSHLLASKVKFQLVIHPKIPKISPSFNNIFLFNTSQELQDSLKKENFQLQTVYPEKLGLLKLIKN